VKLIDAVRVAGARLDEAGVSFGHGTANAFDEAAWLALAALGLPLDALDAHAGRVLDAREVAKIEALVGKRIATRKPTAYLTGEAWLQGVPFHVDERSIVPRSLIAEVIAEGTIEPWLVQAPRRVLDLCTGNGSLAVLAALAWPEAHVDAADISADALEVARRNVERHGLQRRVALHRTDLLDGLPGGYDLVVCNPPYVNAASMARLPSEYRAEPALALDGGADGMDLVRRIVREAPAAMSDGDAVLVLEIGHEREHLEHAFPRLEVVWLETSGGWDQVCLATREQLQRAGRMR
jgi:ribosomal protein L3 glutamine methyltransferase